MERKTFWGQLWLGLRALAVITVMLTTAGVGQAWADGELVKVEIPVDVEPLHFEGITDKTQSQQLWSKLMKYKFWGTGEVVFNKEGFVVRDPYGYTGTAGKKISLDGTETNKTTGAIIFNNGNHTLGGPIISGGDLRISYPGMGADKDKFLTGPVRADWLVLRDWYFASDAEYHGIYSFEKNVFFDNPNRNANTNGDATTAVNRFIENVHKAGGSIYADWDKDYADSDLGDFAGLDGLDLDGSYSKTPDDVPQADKDLSVPVLDESGISWDPAVNLTSSYAGETQYIHVPPITDEDVTNNHLWFDKYVEDLQISGSHGKILYILMPSEKKNANGQAGRLTRIFSKKGINIEMSAADTKIMVVYVNDEATWNGSKWVNFDLSECTIVDDDHYEGNLLFYTNADIKWLPMDSNMGFDIQGTYITSGIFTVYKNINIAGQLIAGKKLLFDDEYNGRFRYVPFNPSYYTGVKYMDWDDTEKKLVSKTTPEGTKVWPIESSNNDVTLPGGWYIAQGDVTINGLLQFTGDTHLILPDGCKMNLSNTTDNYGIFCINADLTIHGQSSGTGSFITNFIHVHDGDITINGGSVSVTNNSTNSHNISNTAIGIQSFSDNGSATITINGGIVKVITNIRDAILAHSTISAATININGGQVNATSGYLGIRAITSSTSSTATLNINGGQVETNGGTGATNYGIYADNIYISLTNGSDFIKAHRYGTHNGCVKIADGKAMKAFIPAATEGDSDKPFAYIAGDHTLTATELTALAGKVLRPATNEDVAITYLDWDDTQKKLVSKNTTTDDNDANDIVYVLTGGGATTLPGGWYVVEGDVTYTGQLFFTGDAHLILADGCKMTVGTSDSRIDEPGLVQTVDYTIHGQTANYGTLSIYTTQDCICPNELTINGGHIIADTDGSFSAINVNRNATINGGIVEARTSDTNGYGIRAGNVIKLGWTFANDYIYVSNIRSSSGESYAKGFIVYDTADGSTAIGIIEGSVSEDAIAGKYLRPIAVENPDGTASPGWLLRTGLDGLTFSGKTDADGKAKPDFTIGTTPYYIYKADDEVTLTTDKDYGQDGVELDASPAVTLTSSTANAATFDMPAADVTINGIKYYIENTGVDYLDWDVTQKKLVSKNTKDLSPTPKVYILTGGGATTLGGGWYMVNNWNTDANMNSGIDAAYTGQLKFTGDAHLILADGSEMTVISNDAGESAIYGDNASLTICAQSEGEGMGDLLVRNNNSDGIYVNATGSGNVGLTINSGDVSGTGKYHGFYAKSSDGNATVTINGGELIGVGGSDGFYAESSGTGNATVTFNGGLVTAGSNDNSTIGATSNSGNATVAINGGQIEANAAGLPIVAKSTSGAAKIILGWTAPSDFIHARKYIVSDGGTVSVADGQYFADYSYTTVEKVYSGTLDDTELGAIAGQTLYPAMPIAGGEKYVSVCSTNGDWKLMDGVKAYVVTGYDTTTGTVTLSEAPLGGLPNGVPVILMKDADGDGSPDGNLGATFTLVGANATEAENIENSVPTTISPLFTAGDGTKTMAQLIFEATGSNDTSDYLVFVLEKGEFRMAAFSDDQVPSADKCFLIVNKLDVLLMIRNGVAPAAAAGARTIAFDLGGSDDTGIERLTFGSSLNGGEWYDLQGRRLDVSPKQKGVYIYQGKKVVIK